MKIRVRRVDRGEKREDTTSKPPKNEFGRSKDKTGREAFWSEPTEEEKKSVKEMIQQFRQGACSESSESGLPRDMPGFSPSTPDLMPLSEYYKERDWRLASEKPEEPEAEGKPWNYDQEKLKEAAKALSPFKTHLVEYDPKIGKPRYKGQKPDSELPAGRTVSAEELAKLREPERHLPDMQPPKKGETDNLLSPGAGSWTEPVSKDEANGIVRWVEKRFREESSGKPKEPEKKAKPKTTEERFDDFMKEKPK